MDIEVPDLENVIGKAIDAVEESQKQIFDITEQARQECEKLAKEIAEVKTDVEKSIAHSDQLDLQLRRARLRLSEVSRNFQNFTEADIRKSYENASKIQLDLFMAREKEGQLRTRRDELERRLRKMEETTKKSEELLTKISVVLEYLNDDISQMGRYIEDARAQQQFGLKIIQAQEEERMRVSREIHDGPAQSMANVTVRMELLEKVMLQRGVSQARDELDDIKKMVRECLSDVRKIIFDLRPMVLDDLGLEPTLQRYIEQMQQQTKIDIRFQTYMDEMKFRLPSSIEVAIYRLVQESLRNIEKHAQARYVDVKIDVRKERILLVVKDDGIGFDVDVDNENGFGLAGMRERVKLLNGQFTLQTTPGRGTKIMIKIPLTMHERMEE